MQRSIEFLKDDRGAVLVYVTVILAAMFGIGALVVDIGRLASTQTELQSFADHLALAVAGELDGKADAITRAEVAFTRAEWPGSQTFATGPHTLTDADVKKPLRYLSGLPANDDAPVDAFVTTDPKLAAYVEITVTPRSVTNWFAGIVNALTGGAMPAASITTATAVAGYTEYVCDITPLMFCVPDANYSPVKGRMVHLKAGNSWETGAFGLLDVDVENGPCGEQNNGASFLRCALARTNTVSQCYTRRGVTVRHGQVSGPVEEGLNVRFDLYGPNFKKETSNVDFGPANNVVWGEIPQKGRCASTISDIDPDYPGNEFAANQYPGSGTGLSRKLPHDQCFGSGDTCNGNRFGDGDWDRPGYLAQNHKGGTAPSGSTRYEIYRDEIDNPPAADRILPDGTQTVTNGKKSTTYSRENGGPTCNTNKAGAERRVLVAAAIDCEHEPLNGNDPVPVLKYVRLFMTEPAGLDSSGGIWVEEIDEVTPFNDGGSGIVHDFVQLYR